MDEKEMRIANLVKELESETTKNDRLEKQNRKLLDDRQNDLPRKEIAEVHQINGRLAERIELTEKQREALEKTLEKERVEKATAERLLKEKADALAKKERELADAQTSKKVNFWAPSVAIACVALIMLFVFLFGGRVSPKGATTIDTAQQALNDVSSLLQNERERAYEDQKPQKNWNISRVELTDEKAVVRVELMYGEKFGQEPKPGASDFVKALMCAAIRRNLHVVSLGDSGGYYLQLNTKRGGGNNFNWSQYLNEELAKNLDSIEDMLPNFTWNIYVDHYGAKKENERRTGVGGVFRNGRFGEHPQEKGGP